MHNKYNNRSKKDEGYVIHTRNVNSRTCPLCPGWYYSNCARKDPSSPNSSNCQAQ